MLFRLLSACLISLYAATAAAGQDETKASSKDAGAEAKSEKKTTDWRNNSELKRRPGSYLGGTLAYVQSRAWAEETDDHGDLSFGPLHTWGLAFRVGDAFADWFAVGFQVFLTNRRSEDESIGAFELMLDASFYPYAGLGIRPSVGIGLGFASGKNDWEFGGGGPACLALAVLYEFRVTRFFSIAPVVNVSWITGENFDGLFLFIGIEFTKWFKTATG